nr:class I SAM-dependent methyltransferase [Sporolactobacillus kofuensis]
MSVDHAHPGGHALTEAMVRLLPIQQGSDVLDVGCGTGATAAYLSETLAAHVTGIDLHPMMVERAKQRVQDSKLPPRIIQASAEAIPFDQDSFDCLLSESVTAFTNVKRSVPEYFRVLRPGGHLMAIEMALEQQIDEKDKQAIKSVYGVDALFTEEDWLTIWHDSGFTNTRVLPVDKLQKRSQDVLPTYNLTSEIDEEVLEVWLEHMQTLQTYQHVLSYRIFHARKPD